MTTPTVIEDIAVGRKPRPAIIRFGRLRTFYCILFRDTIRNDIERVDHSDPNFGHAPLGHILDRADPPHMARSATWKTVGQRKRIELSEDRAVVVTLRPGDREIDVEEDGIRWTFVVGEDGHAELCEVYADGPTTRQDVPSCVEEALEGMGVRGVDR
jgi:hypothetical protein